MTRKLYYEDSHMREFEGMVIACEKTTENSGLYRIVLDQTAFFPEGGGQSADSGSLDGIEVLDVQEKEGIIYHICKDALQEGKRIKGCLDFEKRFDKMQNHSGEHIVSGLIHQHFGYENVGFHLGTEVTMDFSGELGREELLMIEREANEAVIRNIPVLAEFPDKQTLEAMTYRSKIELTGDVRIVTIPGYDCCACCAPHVRLTGEIGMIKLLSGQKYKGGTRVTMVCGFRALADYNQKSEQITAVSVLLSAKQTEISEAVSHIKDEMSALKGQMSSLKQQIIAAKAEQAEEGSPCICMFEPELNGNEIRTLVNLCMEKTPGLCIVLTGSEEDGYQYVAGSRTLDVREFGKALNESFAGRGGGKPEMVQGSLKGTRKSIEEWIVNKAV